MRRGAPLKRTGWIKRGGYMPRVNRERLARRRAEAFGRQADLCRSLPCVGCGADPPSDPHHARSRGAGGKDSDTIPTCRRCHDRIHTGGLKAWERETGVCAAEVARALARSFAA